MSNALQRLKGVASDFGATLTVHGAYAAAEITITLPSGLPHVFALELTDHGERVSAREAPAGHRLPRFCPDRHINSDGSFCLGWGQEDPGHITDEQAARTWWSAVVRFLTYQLNATKRGVWPGRENDRAHGDAAKYQAIAEPLATQFGPAFVRDLHRGALTVRSDNRRRNPRVELYRHGKRIARAFLNSQRLAPDRIACPCEASGTKPIGECGEHAQSLALFAVALHRWRSEERDFLRALAKSRQSCCGTLRECGLRTAQACLGTPAPKGSTHDHHARARRRRRR